MSEHYYSKSPKSSSNPTKFQTTIQSISLTFQTDDGVFSKKQIDYGTKTLLEQFQFPETVGDILDVGCGYGPIGITVAKMAPERRINMFDVNERAVDLAEKNISLNYVSNAEASVEEGIHSFPDDRYAVVVTNPPFRAGKKVVHEIVEESKRVMVKQGELWLVVQKKQGAPSLQAKMEDVFGNVEVMKRDKGYFILKSRKID
ncbi:class I SAM-dependent methyltransferase [Halalkalibacillus halophilus]|uniref:class I SAM-dependent methyltransferase n=1 Tax=Halalkalibacillus halophilus TaxID=392827 RepID=UPI000424F885|nr:class I SAM-dependent methyltransferase [Halalkalibacillus halophilus]